MYLILLTRGGKFGSTIDTNLIFDALMMAIRDENPSFGTIFHSDQVAQYYSYQFQDLLSSEEFRVSMIRKEQCFDNDVAE